MINFYIFHPIFFSVSQGPEPKYDKVVTGYKVYHHKEPFKFQYNDGILPELQVAYETYGELNAQRSNAILIFTGLSASSHARSHELNSTPGWWEQFVGPELAVNTSKYFVICANHLGSCYGSTGTKSVQSIDQSMDQSSYGLVERASSSQSINRWINRLND